MQEPTKRQQDILDWISGFVQEHRMPPTVREIGRAFGIASSSVFKHLKALERKGLLKRGAMGPRSIELPHLPNVCDECESLPLLGRIAAGTPTFAAENVEDSISIDKRFAGKGRCFALRVQGESMIEAGIFDGDIAIVRQQPRVEDGEIAVCLVEEEEATLKRVYREPGGMVRLQPENSRMTPIVIRADELIIQGKVVAVQREVS